jgi:hypothetical protein
VDLVPVLLTVTCSRASILKRTVLQHHQLEMLIKSKAEEFHPVFHPSLMLHTALFPHRMAEQADSHLAACVPTRRRALPKKQSTLMPEVDFFQFQAVPIRSLVESYFEKVNQHQIVDKTIAT